MQCRRFPRMLKNTTRHASEENRHNEPKRSSEPSGVHLKGTQRCFDTVRREANEFQCEKNGGIDNVGGQAKYAAQRCVVPTRTIWDKTK